VAYVDFKKAFDSVGHSALFETLEYHGLGSAFVDLIRDLYADCRSDIYLNNNVSGSFPVERGVRQGDTLSPLLFILAINPALSWINGPGQGYAFRNGTRVPVSGYCDDIALLGEDAAGIITAFNKLVTFGLWAGLDINPNKSAYTVARDAVRANLRVPSTRNGVPVTTPVPFLPPSSSYRYMGVMINADLDWSEQLQHVRDKVTAYQHLIRNKRLTTDNKIYVSNAVSNAFVAYSMGIVPYTKEWLLTIQHIILTTIKQSMQVPTNAEDEPFFMPASEGGRGLVHLLDLQVAIKCSSTLRELTSMALSSTTTNASWNHAYTVNGSLIDGWVKALADQGWQAWPKLRDLDWVGHFTQDPALAHSLVGRGILRWSQLVQGGRLRPRTQITDVAGVAVSPRTYERIASAVASLPSVPGPVHRTECSLRELNKFSPGRESFTTCTTTTPRTPSPSLPTGHAKMDQWRLGLFWPGVQKEQSLLHPGRAGVHGGRATCHRGSVDLCACRCEHMRGHGLQIRHRCYRRLALQDLQQEAHSSRG
jgi:hypothetical protein